MWSCMSMSLARMLVQHIFLLHAKEPLTVTHFRAKCKWIITFNAWFLRLNVEKHYFKNVTI